MGKHRSAKYKHGYELYDEEKSGEKNFEEVISNAMSGVQRILLFSLLS